MLLLIIGYFLLRLSLFLFFFNERLLFLNELHATVFKKNERNECCKNILLYQLH